MLLTLTSPSGSPGVSTTALALTLYRQGFSLLVEADPVGSSPTLAGFLRGRVSHQDYSLKNLIDPDRLGQLRGAIASQTVKLGGSDSYVLPGLVHAGQADAMARTWPHLADQLVEYRQRATVVVDAGRMGTAPKEVLRRSDVIAIMIQPELRSIYALQSSLVPFVRDLANSRSKARVGLIVVGDKFGVGVHQYGAREIVNALKDHGADLPPGFDVITTLPNKPSHAASFSGGKRLGKWVFRRSPYIHALNSAWPRIEAFHLGRPARGSSTSSIVVPSPSLAPAGGSR